MQVLNYIVLCISQYVYIHLPGGRVIGGGGGEGGSEGGREGGGEGGGE